MLRMLLPAFAVLAGAYYALGQATLNNFTSAVHALALVGH